MKKTITTTIVVAHIGAQALLPGAITAAKDAEADQTGLPMQQFPISGHLDQINDMLNTSSAATSLMARGPWQSLNDAEHVALRGPGIFYLWPGRH